MANSAWLVLAVIAFNLLRAGAAIADEGQFGSVYESDEPACDGGRA
jgi:hypothetical protein